MCREIVRVGIIESAKDLRYDIRRPPGFYYSGTMMTGFAKTILSFDPGPQLPWYWPMIWDPAKWQAMIDSQLGRMP